MVVQEHANGNATQLVKDIVKTLVKMDVEKIVQ